MTVDIWLALSLFAFVTSITPGPNNLMLLASGVNFGVRKSVPHMLGISIGFMVMVLAVGLGLAQIFAQLPWTYVLLKWIGVAYMLYLAWGIATAEFISDDGTGTTQHKPVSFIGAAAFQWVNPKAWVMAVSTFSTYIPANSSLWVIVAAAVLFGVVNLPSVSVWALFGAKLRRVLQVPRNFRAFNYAMALLLVLSLLPMLAQRSPT